MILYRLSITYNDGEKGIIDNVRYIDFDDTALSLICSHRVSLTIPLENIDVMNFERRYPDAGSDEETKYKSQVL